jgi:hypothetical protein
MGKDEVPLFTPDDWQQWSFVMESHLRAKRCFGSIDRISDRWPAIDNERRHILSDKAFNEILRSLGQKFSALAIGFQPGQARGLWEALQQEFRQDHVPGQFDLAAEFKEFAFQEGESITDFLCRFDTITNKLADAGIPVNEANRFLQLMDALPPDMEQIKTIMIANGDDNILGARRLLRRHTRRLTGKKDSLLKISDQRMPKKKYSSSSASRPCFYCKRDGHLRSECHIKQTDERLGYYLPSRDAPWRAAMIESISKRVDEAVLQAVRKAQGKLSVNLAALSKTQEKEEMSDTDEDQSLNIVAQAYEDAENGFSFFVLTDGAPDETILAHSTSRWILDSGASAHITGDRSLLNNVREVRRNFTTGNASSPIIATHIGDVVFKNLANEKPTTVPNVYYSPQTNISILSLQVLLAEENATAKFTPNSCTVLKGGKKMFHATLENDKLYCVSSHTANVNKILLLSYSKSLNEWHSLLGHLHPRAIIEMARLNLVEGLPKDLSMTDWKPCPICAMGKQTKRKRKHHSKFSVPQKLASMPGDTWHSDQKGPINPLSVHGHRYTLLFVDDSTGYTEAIHLTSLTETEDAYQKHKQRVKTLFNKNIKRFICDGHGTYKKIIPIMEEDGTVIQFRAPYDPNGNAVAERTIRTIFEMARTMIQQSGMPQNRWEEAVDLAVWIRNRAQTARLSNSTPYEAYFRLKPDVRHLHPFGCLAQALIPADTRSTRTFDPLSRRCAFLGFSKHHNAFILYDIERKKQIVSRDVLFFDDEFPLKGEPFTKNGEEMPSRPTTDPAKFSIGKSSLRSYAPNMESTDVYANPDIDMSDPKDPSTDPLPGAPYIDKAASDLPNMDNPIQTPSATGENATVDESHPHKEGNTMKDQFPPNFAQGDNHRDNTPPLYLNQLLLIAMERLGLDTPATLDEALSGPNKKEWLDGLAKEFKGIFEHKVFRHMTELERKILRTTNPKIFENHCIFKLKKDESGEVARWKVRLVLQGCNMKKGIHFEETYAPCTRLETVRLMMAIAVQKKWKVTHADVPNAYLHGNLDRLVFTHLPMGWNQLMGDELGKDGDPVVLDKALYGAPNAGRAWNQVINAFLLKLGFIASPNETGFYSHPSGTIIALWVDDIFITGPDDEHIKDVLDKLHAEYKTKNLGHISFALGIHFQHLTDGSYFLSQKSMIDDLVKGVRLDEARPCSSPLPAKYSPTNQDAPQNVHQIGEMKNIPYRSTLGKLLYIAMATRPDIVFAVISLARYGNNPGKSHWSFMKQVVRYLKSTNTLGLHYKYQKDELSASGWSDASYNCCPDTGRSIIGHCLELNGCIWLWHSSTTKTLPKSTQHAEIIAASKCLDKMRWASYLLDHAKIKYVSPMPLYVDNKAAIQTMSNPVCTKESRHIAPAFFDLRYAQDEKVILITFVPTDKQKADVLTKSLAGAPFQIARKLLSVDYPNP